MSRSQAGQAPAKYASQRLESWKEIAAYLNRDLSTLRRWEEKEGLPIYRERRKSRTVICAYKSELNAWMAKHHPETETVSSEAALSDAPPGVDEFIAPDEPIKGVQAAAANARKGSTRVHRTNWRTKWIDRSVAVLVVLLLASVATLAYNRWRLSPAGPPARAIESLAVLPLKDYSLDGQEAFADGVAEMLIADLSQINDLQVTAGSATLRYRHARRPLQQIARDLRVDAIVEGYVERAQGRVRITARLFDLRDGIRASSLTYERDLSELRAVSAEAARAIASQLPADFTPRQHARLRNPARVDPLAYDAYFKGLSYWRQLSCDGFTNAQQYFQQAVLLAPSYAAAHSRLASTYFKLAEFGCEPPSTVIPRARASAARAMALDHNLPEPHAVLGMVSFLYDWDWQSAHTELKRATELNPSDAMARSWYGTFLYATGRHAEAFAQFKKARDIDPAPGMTWLVYAYALYHARRYDEALGHFQRVLEAYPQAVPAYFGTAACYERKRMRGKALQHYMKAKELSGVPPETLVALRSASWTGGLKAFWRKELELAASRSRADACWSAVSAAHVGDPAQMLGMLEKAYNARCSNLASLKVDPLYDKLRQEPRFQRIIQRMGLPYSKPPVRKGSTATVRSAKKTSLPKTG